MQIDSPARSIPIEPGTPFEGGFFVGRIRIGEQQFALIVSPKSEGDALTTWGVRGADVPAACSFFDGLANTLAMAEAGNSLATTMTQLNIGGFTDWYLPSRDELELIYRNLKPGTDDNYRHSGDNPSSVPPGYAYMDAVPPQTSALAFQVGSEQALERAWYWSSTQYSAPLAWSQWFAGGGQILYGKSYEGRARAVRRLVIE